MYAIVINSDHDHRGSAININNGSVGNRRSGKGVEQICEVVSSRGRVGHFKRRLRCVRHVGDRGKSHFLLVGRGQME